MSIIKLFQSQQIRSHWDEERETWYFSVIDIIQVLTGNERPRKYWSDLKSKLRAEGSQLSEKIGQLKMQSADKQAIPRSGSKSACAASRFGMSSPNAKGFIPNKIAATAGGKIAGNARRELEQQSGAKVSSSENYKELPEASRKKIKPGKKNGRTKR